MNFNELVFDTTTAPSDDIVAYMNEIIKNNMIKESKIAEVLNRRFFHIVENQGNCEMSLNDDKLIAIAIHNFDIENPVWGYAFMAAEYKLKPYITKTIVDLKVERQDWDDYFSEARKVMFEKISDYNSSIAALVTFMGPHLRHAFYAYRNDNSRYYSTLIKLAIKARDALKEANLPVNNKSIAEYINTVTPLSRDVSPKQIENALAQYVSVSDLDENSKEASETKNPEAVYLKREYSEELKNACDAENWAVKAMYEVFRDYYLDENTNRSNTKPTLPVAYLKKEMCKKTGIDFPDDKIKSIFHSMGDALKRNGFGRGMKNQEVFVEKKPIDECIITPDELNNIMNEMIAIGNTMV